MFAETIQKGVKMNIIDSLKLSAFQRKFKCHVCGKPSSGPRQDYTQSSGISQSGDQGEWRGPKHYYYDWDSPSDLFRCPKCNQLTCDNCRLYSDSLGHVCKYCKPDWELKIERARLQEIEDAKRKKQQQEEFEQKRRDQERRDRARLDKEKYDHLLVAHQQRFRCNVCSKPSAYPYGYTSGGIVRPPDECDWSKPGDFEICRICKKWVCRDHIHAGVCKSCAYKL